MASSKDCKELLDNEGQTQGAGPWIRLFKRKHGKAWIRGFSSKKNPDLFAAIHENDDGNISLMNTWSSREEMERACFETNEPNSLFTAYPPSEYDIEQASGTEFTGRIVYGYIELDETDGNAVQFMLSYETDEGIFTGHSEGIDQMVSDILGKHFGDRLEVSVMEGTHTVRVREDGDEVEEEDDEYQAVVDEIIELLNDAGVVDMDKDEPTPARGRRPAGM